MLRNGKWFSYISNALWHKGLKVESKGNVILLKEIEREWRVWGFCFFGDAGERCTCIEAQFPEKPKNRSYNITL